MSDSIFQLCRFCQRNVKLTYYCESCGASCCSDCLNEERSDYFICQDCESKNIIKQNGIRICGDCGKDNIVKISQHVKSCPKCHSHQIINIYEKREELEQRFLELIKETRSFLKPFQEIINKLYILREKIKQARDPPIRCYHYPRMESELFDLFKTIIYIKDNLLEKINIHFQHLGLNKEYFFDIHNQPNSNIRIIEGILENLYRGCDVINEYIGNNLSLINTHIEKLQQNLKFIEKINKKFLEYKRFLNLAEKEKPVFAIRCKLQNGMNTQDSFKKNRGILFITNFDLTFIHEHGLFKKKQEKIFKAPVADLVKIYEKGTFFKKLYIEFPYGKYEFSLNSEAIPKVIDWILLARSFDEQVIYDEVSARKLYEINLDLNDLSDFIEEGIISFFNIKCQYNKNNQFSNDKYSFEKNESYFTHADHFSHNTFANQDLQQFGNENQYRESYNSQYRNYNTMQTQFSKNYRQGNNFVDINRTSNFKNQQPIFHDNKEKNTFNYRNSYNFKSNFGRNPDSFHINNMQSRRLREKYNINYYDDLTPEEKLILMKRLEKAQKYGYKTEFGFNTNNFPSINQQQRTYKNLNEINTSFTHFTDRHLTDLFDRNRTVYPQQNNISPPPYEIPGKNFDEFNYFGNKLDELKRERYGLRETLKQLDAKFNAGLISEYEYFRNYKEMQKELYSIESQIKSIENRFKENQFYT
ncbi:MAG: hypothetical protein ACTSVV_15400 [Promethearchaeota archaeon]